MKNLFLIDGASGTGKSDLLKYVSEYEFDCISMPKYSTREKREYEVSRNLHLDLESISETEFNELKLDFQYKYGGYKYGFRKSDLNKNLQKSQNVFLIVRDSKLIKKLTDIYSFINVIPVFIYTDMNLVTERLSKEGYNDDQINYRTEKVKSAFRDYLNAPHLYTDMLINNSSYDNYINLIRSLIRKHEATIDIKDNLVYVLMSFNKNNPKLTDNYNAIKRAVEGLNNGFNCRRLDDSIGSYKISETCKRQIRNCRIAVFDLTENKQNVYYELGFAQGIGKTCVLIAEEGTETQFYSNEYKILFYKSLTELENKMKIEISKSLEQ